MKIYYFREGESNSNHPPSPHSGKPLFEICGFYMGIAQIALDPCPPPLCQPGKRGKKESARNHSDKPIHPTPPYGQCPFGNNTFQKGSSVFFCNYTQTLMHPQSTKHSTNIMTPYQLTCPPPSSSNTMRSSKT